MKKVFPFLIIYLIVTVLYYPVFTTFFSQDDFFHFKVSLTDGTLTGFLNLFGFHPFEERGIAFYRPIFREALYNIFYSLFGLNHIPFRILSFSIHFINIFLVYILIQKVFQKKYLSLFVAFFFGISSSNVATLYYLAGGIQTLGATMFILITLILFIRYLETNHIYYSIFSFLTFLLALGSHELAATTPLLLSGLAFAYFPLKKSVKKIRILIPFFIILAAYLYLNVTKIGFSAYEQQYQINLNIKTLLNSLMWYSGWALGLPEMLIDFMFPGFKLNPTLMRYWGNYFNIIFLAFGIALILFGSIFISLLLKQKVSILNKKFILLLIWFPISIAPVLFLPFHKSTYYLAPSLSAFWGSVGFIIFTAYQSLKKRSHKLALSLVIIFISALLILNITSTLLGNSTYWAAQRGRIAEKLIDQVKQEYPVLPKGAIVYFKNDPNYPFVAKEWGGSSKQASLVLNGSDALQFLYRDPSLKVFYEDLKSIPQYYSQDIIYSLVARLY